MTKFKIIFFLLVGMFGLGLPIILTLILGLKALIGYIVGVGILMLLRTWLWNTRNFLKDYENGRYNK